MYSIYDIIEENMYLFTLRAWQCYLLTFPAAVQNMHVEHFGFIKKRNYEIANKT